MIELPSSASQTSSAILLAVLVGAFVQGMRINVLLGTNTSQRFHADTFDLVSAAIAIAVVIAAAGLLVNAAEGIVAVAAPMRRSWQPARRDRCSRARRS